MSRAGKHASAAARIKGRVMRRAIAAYLLDRADQYDTDSSCWHGLADAAQAVARGEAEEAAARGEFDVALYDRVDYIASRGPAPKVDPVAGVGCECGHSPEEHGNDPEFPGSKGCSECACITYERAR